ncbi:MAG: glyoxylate/hydroxypyruvate reductase A [Pseudomonadota bacterium]
MSKSPLLLSVNFTEAEKLGDIRDGMPGRPVIDWAKGERPESLNGVKYALVWEFDHDLFDRMPDLEVIFSAGAGVDKVLANPALPDGIPIVRFVDPTLTTRMGEWVCLQCLMHLRQQRKYDALQRERTWQGLTQPQAHEISIGIMGLGVLGQDVAAKLKMLGFQVSGWSRTKKQVEGISCYDAGEIDAFLSQVHYVVGLLPYTPETHEIFNRSLFEKLKKHPVLPSPIFINAGRGRSQSEQDIVDCLRDGTLEGVSLDVFENEPLRQDSELWGFENAILTPHVASDSDVVALGKYVDEKIEVYEAGEGLDNLVDRQVGY